MARKYAGHLTEDIAIELANIAAEKFDYPKWNQLRVAKKNMYREEAARILRVITQAFVV